jgi:hypothetical protein
MRSLFVLLIVLLTAVATLCLDLENVKTVGHLDEIDRFTITKNLRESTNLMASVQLARAQNKTNSNSIALDSIELKQMAGTLFKIPGLKTNIVRISWESWKYFKGASVLGSIDGRAYFILLVKPNGTNWVVVDKKPWVGMLKD